MNNVYTYDQLINMDPMTFMKWAINEFHIEIPTQIENVDDSCLVGELLAKTANSYFYLCELQGVFKILSRDAGRKGDKKLKEDIIDKNTLIDEIGKGVKQQYQTLSRMITVRHNNLEELKMSDGRGFSTPNNFDDEDIEDDIDIALISNHPIQMSKNSNLPKIQPKNIIKVEQPITKLKQSNLPTPNEIFKSVYH